MSLDNTYPAPAVFTGEYFNPYAGFDNYKAPFFFKALNLQKS
jgi:hypothetical protein